MNIKGIIFDLDGTLADTIDDLRTAMNFMLSQKGYPTLTREGILRNINNGAREFLRGSLPEEERNNETVIDECMEIYFARYRECYADTTHLYDGMSEAVSELYKMGIKLGVFSNKQDEQVQDLIHRMFPNGEFSQIMGHLNFPHKPDPAGALYIADTFGIKPEETLFVGDSNIDMLTSVNAGMYPVGVSWGYRSVEILLEAGAKKIVYSPCEIIDICRQM